MVVPFAALGVFGGCALVSALLPLPRFMDGESTRSAIFVLGLFGFLFTFVVAVIGAALWLRTRAFNRLDAAFTPLGLAGRGYLLTGRQYQGLVEGRLVTATFSRRRSFGGFGSNASLKINLEAALKTQTTLAIKSALGAAISQAFGRQPMPLADPDFDQLAVYASDEPWTRALLADPAARAAALTLIAAPGANMTFAHGRAGVVEHLPPGPSEIRRLDIGPKAVMLWLNGMPDQTITPENVRAWLDLLGRVARASEALPAPSGAS
jgi:hypothetical protein